MDHSPLRRLSGELRNEIYSYVMHDPADVVLCLCGRHHPFRPHILKPEVGDLWTYAGSYLPRVCRELRLESLSYFYDVNCFVLPLGYLTVANGHFKLEQQWDRFVQVFGAPQIRQIKHMTVLAGNAITKGADISCAFARGSVRPSLHPSAQMLLQFETGVYGVPHLWVDFDNYNTLAARTKSIVRTQHRTAGQNKAWRDHLGRWSSDSVLDSTVLEDTLMHLGDCNDTGDETLSALRDTQTVAGLLNIVRSTNLGRLEESEVNAEVTEASFLATYAPFAGRKYKTGQDINDCIFPLDMSIEDEAPSTRLTARRRTQIHTLPSMEDVFLPPDKAPGDCCWNWERSYRSSHDPYE